MIAFSSNYKHVSFGKARWSCVYKLAWTRIIFTSLSRTSSNLFDLELVEIKSILYQIDGNFGYYSVLIGSFKYENYIINLKMHPIFGKCFIRPWSTSTWSKMLQLKFPFDGTSSAIFSIWLLCMIHCHFIMSVIIPNQC